MSANIIAEGKGRGRIRDRCRRAVCGAIFFASAIYIALGTGAQARVGADGDAARFVARVVQEVINVLGAPGQAVSQRHRKIQNIFDRALDLDSMARRVLGRHWRSATKPQKETYVRLFRRYVLGIYAVQLSGFAGENFSVLRQQSSKPTESLVIARITRQYGTPLNLSFRVRQAGDKHRIVDVKA